MDYNKVIDSVVARLADLNVEAELERGGYVSSRDIQHAEARMGIALPQDVRRFYETVGDGVLLAWSADERDYKKPQGGLEIPTLDYLAGMYTGWRSIALYTPEKAEAYGFPYTKDPSLAKRTAARMWNWLPVIEEGNGDMICVDLSAPTHAAIFNQHDWLDGGTGENGHVLAPTLGEFILDWSRVCFQMPKSLWWPVTFSQPTGVNWTGDEFRDPFRFTPNR